MIADHYCDFSVEFAGLLALQKIFQAMRQARCEHRDFGFVVAEVEFELHGELLGQWTKAIGDLIAGDLESGKMKFEAGQKDAGFNIGILVRLENIAAVFEMKVEIPETRPFWSGQETSKVAVSDIGF